MGTLVARQGIACTIAAALLVATVFGAGTDRAIADDVLALKQQLAALGSRLDDLEATPVRTVDQGVSRISFQRGSVLDAPDPAAFEEGIPEDRGLTLYFSPAADVPVPRHEVTLSGFVKGNVIYDAHDNLGDIFNVGAITTGAADNGPHFRIHARHSRVRLKSKSETEVGTVRTYVESDFFGTAGNQRISNSDAFRLRHAWADWDSTDNFNIGVGQTWSNFMSGFALPPRVDVAGPAGRVSLRQGQVRLTYKNSASLFALAAENPETDIQAGLTPGGSGPAGVVCNESSAPNSCSASDRLPDFTARLYHKTGDNHQFQISGVLRELRTDGDAAAVGFAGTDSTLGWGVLGAASFDFSPLTARIQVTYGDGIGRYGSRYHANRAAIAPDPANINLQTVEAFSVMAGLTLEVTPQSKLTASYGRAGFARRDTLVGQSTSLQNVNINWLYRPASAVQFGLEANWGELKVRGAGKDDALRFGFATWFFF